MLSLAPRPCSAAGTAGMGGHLCFLTLCPLPVDGHCFCLEPLVANVLFHSREVLMLDALLTRSALLEDCSSLLS